MNISNHDMRELIDIAAMRADRLTAQILKILRHNVLRYQRTERRHARRLRELESALQTVAYRLERCQEGDREYDTAARDLLVLCKERLG